MSNDSSVCGQIEPLLEAFYDDGLDSVQTQLVASHVADCSVCAERLRGYRELDRLIQLALVPRAGPALRESLRETVYARIAATPAPRTALWPLSRLRVLGSPGGVPTNGGAATAPRPGSSAPALDPHPTTSLLPSRPPRAWISGGALVAVVAALVLVLLLLPPFHRGSVGNVATATSTAAHPTSTFAALPAFHDWRVAYLAGDGSPDPALHIVSLDGKHDITGPRLAGLNTMSKGAAISPDGRYLAYIDAPQSGNVVIADLEAQSPPGGRAVTATLQASDISWSPDSARLAVDGTLASIYGLYLVDARSGSLTLVPGTGVDTRTGMPAHAPATGQLTYTLNALVTGWLDATHVVVTGLRPQSGTPSCSSPCWSTPGGSPAATPPPTPTPNPAVGQVPNTALAASPTPSPAATPTAPPLATPSMAPAVNPTPTPIPNPPAGCGGQAAVRSGGALLSVPRSSGVSYAGSLDVTTGAVQSIPVSANMGITLLAPDGRQALLASGANAGCMFQPVFAVLDLTSDQARALTHIAAATSGTLSFGGWKPGTTLVAATLLGRGQPDQFKLVLLDVGNDSMTPIRQGVEAIAWSPDGQTLVVAAGASLSELEAMSPVAPGVAPVPLTMASGRFLGFVRTA